MFPKLLQKKADSSTDVTNVAGANAASIDTPWINAVRAYEDRSLRQQAQTANWRRAAAFAMLIALTAVIGMAYIGSKSKFIPMVFEVDTLGQIVAVKALQGDEAVKDPARLVYREVFDLFENLRSVTTDKMANNSRITKGFSVLDGRAARYAKEELMKAPPNTVGASKTVQVIVRSALKVTGKTWQVDWEEHSRNLAGENIGVEYWRATLTYELSPSEEEKKFKGNPIGFKVTEISWQRVSKQ